MLVEGGPARETAAFAPVTRSPLSMESNWTLLGGRDGRNSGGETACIGGTACGSRGVRNAGRGALGTACSDVKV